MKLLDLVMGPSSSSSIGKEIMNSEPPRTSIIMPVYKTGNRVVAAVESVLAQTDPDFELLIMIDASPDDAAERIATFLEKNPDSRVRVFDNPVNRGVSAVRNQGLAEARGQWLAFLDSDDRYRPNFLSTLHAYAENHAADVVVAGHTLVETDGTSRDRFRGTPGVRTGQQAALELLSDQLTPYVWDKLIRAEIVTEVRFPEDIHRAEDAVYCLHAYAAATKVAVIPTSLYEYTIDAGGLTWGKITPVAESKQLMTYLQDAASSELLTQEGQRAFSVSWLLTFINNAQQALVVGGPESDSVIRACRQNITWGQVVATARLRPIYAAAATLLKISPALYRTLYGAYVRRTYGI